MAEVKFRNVSKQYGRSPRVIHGLDLDIGDGELVVLVGPSGCGKSTTLRMLAGLEAVSGGEILIDGRRVNDVHPRDRDIEMVFQSYALYPHMNVYQNLALSLKVRRVPQAEIARRIKYAAEVLGIGELLDRRPSELSGGQKQRVAVGRAIVREPKVFLFDEPLSNLDAKLRVQMRAEIGALHTRLNATMVYVTHDQVEAMTLGTRVVVMRDGRVQQVAPPMELFNEPANMFVAGFIGNPPMTFVTGTLARDPPPRFVNRDGSLVCKVPDSLSERTGDIVLGVRPEHLRLSSNADGGFTAVPSRIEPLGSEFILYLDVGPDRLVARMPADAPIGNAPLCLTCPVEHLRFFDPQTEQRLPESLGH
jgi:multiple sugar transport system ATP-binding protein